MLYLPYNYLKMISFFYNAKSWEISKVLAFINAGTKNADILREINFDKFIVSKTVILPENNLDYLHGRQVKFTDCMY